MNNTVFHNIFEKEQANENKLYKVIFREFELQNQEKRYEISDVQVVRTFERRELQGKSYPIYKFNILSKNILFFIFQNSEKLNSFFEKYYVLLDKDTNIPKWDAIEYLYKTIIETI